MATIQMGHRSCPLTLLFCPSSILISLRLIRRRLHSFASSLLLGASELSLEPGLNGGHGRVGSGAEGEGTFGAKALKAAAGTVKVAQGGEAGPVGRHAEQHGRAGCDEGGELGGI